MLLGLQALLGVLEDSMRRVAIALAVLVTVLAVAPAGGAQCDPTCGQSLVEKAGDIGPDDSDDHEGSGLENPHIRETGSAGPVLP